MKNIKIMFIDLDGTLMNNNKEISKYTSGVFKKITDRGIHTVICSGRTNIYSIEKSKIVNASNIVISSNGSLIYDYLNNIKIYESEINMEELQSFHTFSIQNNIACIYNSVSKRFRNKNSDKAEAIVFENVDEIDDTVSQIVAYTTEFKNVELIENYIYNNEVLEVCNCSNSVVKKDSMASKYSFDIGLKGTTKGNAIKILLDYLGIDKNDAICFGDHVNDYSMFEACGYKVAMQNGMDELKEKADFIAESNDEDGVAKFIEKNIL